MTPGTYRFFNQVLSNYGIETTFINTTDTDLLEKTIKENTKVRAVILCSCFLTAKIRQFFNC